MDLILDLLLLKQICRPIEILLRKKDYCPLFIQTNMISKIPQI
nr:MAG TPA: hypothetical protein [Caudoviricetes sp.]